MPSGPGSLLIFNWSICCRGHGRKHIPWTEEWELCNETNENWPWRGHEVCQLENQSLQITLETQNHIWLNLGIDMCNSEKHIPPVWSPIIGHMDCHVLRVFNGGEVSILSMISNMCERRRLLSHLTDPYSLLKTRLFTAWSSSISRAVLGENWTGISLTPMCSYTTQGIKMFSTNFLCRQ